MNDKNNQGEYSKLSIASLVTGILTYICIFLIYLLNYVCRGNITGYIISNLLLFGLAITAVVCGIVDINRIVQGRSSSKSKSFDIAGIVLGSFFILVYGYLICIDIVDKINGEGQPLF